MSKNSVINDGHACTIGCSSSDTFKKRNPASYEQQDSCGRGKEGRSSRTVLSHDFSIHHEPRRFDLHENDVLLGRGTGPNTSPGNVRFRRIVWETFQEQLAAKSPASSSSLKKTTNDKGCEESAVPHDESTRKKDAEIEGAAEPPPLDSRTKNEVALKVLSKFQEAGQGRFLKKLTKAEAVSFAATSPHQSDKVLWSTKHGLYEEVSNKEVLEKIKLTLRFQIEDHARRQASSAPRVASRSAASQPETSTKTSSKLVTESDVLKTSNSNLYGERPIGSVGSQGGGSQVRAGIESSGLLTRAAGLIYKPLVVPSLIPAALVTPTNVPQTFEAHIQPLLSLPMIGSSITQQRLAASVFLDEPQQSQYGDSLLALVASRLNDPLWMTPGSGSSSPELCGDPNLLPRRHHQQGNNDVGRVDSILALLLLMRRQLEEEEEQRARDVLLQYLTGTGFP
jgi:hypothetical protein